MDLLPALIRRGLDGDVHVPRLADRRGLHRRRASSASATPRSSPHVTKQVIDRYLTPLLIGQDPVGHRVPLAAHVPQDDGVRAARASAWSRSAPSTSRCGTCSARPPSQPVYRLLGGRTKPRIPVYASRLYSTPLDELAAEARALQGRRLPGDEAALRLGTGRRRRRHAAQRRSGAHRARDGRRRRRRHGRRLHGLDARLRQAHAAAARAVQPALARGGGDSRRHPGLRRAQGLRPRADRRRRARVHAARLPRPARGARASTSSSSTPTASAASTQARKIAALAEALPGAGRSRTPGRCTTITS